MNLRTFIYLKQQLRRFDKLSQTFKDLINVPFNEESFDLLSELLANLKELNKLVPDVYIGIIRDRWENTSPINHIMNTMHDCNSYGANAIILRIATISMSSTPKPEELTNLLEAEIISFNPKLPNPNVIPMVGLNNFPFAYLHKELKVFSSLSIMKPSDVSHQKILAMVNEAVIYLLISYNYYSSPEKAKEAIAQNQPFITKDFISLAKNKFEKNCETISEEVIDHQINEFENKVLDDADQIKFLEGQIHSAYKAYELNSRLLAECMLNKNTDYSKGITLLKSFSEFLAIRKASSGFELDVLAKATVDPSLVHAKFIHQKSRLDFMTDLVNNEIEIYFASTVYINMVTGAVDSLKDSTTKLLWDIGRYDDHMTIHNPHHMNARCFGSYKENIKSAVKNEQWIAVGLMIRDSVGQLNLMDSVIRNSFFERVENGEALYSFKYKGEVMSFNAYRKKKEQEEMERANQSQPDGDPQTVEETNTGYF